MGNRVIFFDLFKQVFNEFCWISLPNDFVLDGRFGVLGDFSFDDQNRLCRVHATAKDNREMVFD